MRQDNAGNILISRVLHGSVADRSKQLHAGDVIHEINGQTLRGKTIDDVADMMVSLVYCCRSSISLSLSISNNSRALLCSRSPQHFRNIKHRKETMYVNL